MTSDSSNQMLPRRSNRLRLLKEPPSPLVSLHPEIWTLILKKLTDKEALNLRRVNKDFKAKVDNLYEDWVIVLDENCPYLDTILDLRVKKVYVKRLMNPILNRPPGTIFKHPNLLKTIINRMDPGISPENLHILLSQCKMVEWVMISLKDSVEHDAFWATLDHHIGYDLPELYTLWTNIYYDVNQSVHLPDGSFSERLLTRSRMPNLKSLNVTFTSKLLNSQELYYIHAKTVFLFLIRHGQTLKDFNFNNFLGKEIAFTPLSPEQEISLLQNCRTLETMHLSSYCPSKVLNETWKRLILAQSKLVDLSLFNDALLFLGWNTCARICASNFQTLIRFSIDSLKLDGETGRFDVSMFSKCVNLKYFKFSPVPSESTELCNLFTLPERIEELSLFNCFISADDMSKFLKSHPNLVSFMIGLTKNSGQYGVTGSVLEDILKHGSLKIVRINPDSIVLQDTISELAKMNAIFSNLGCQKFGNQFDFTRLFMNKRTDSNGTSKWVAF